MLLEARACAGFPASNEFRCDWGRRVNHLQFACARCVDGALARVPGRWERLGCLCLANTLSVTFRRALQLQQREKSWLTSDDCAPIDPKLADCDATPQNQTVSDRHELLRRDEVLGTSSRTPPAQVSMVHDCGGSLPELKRVRVRRRS